MLHKNKRIISFIILFILCLHGILSAGQDQKQDQKTQDQNFLFDFYQKHISPADGQRCQMYPSCSAYSSRSFKKHGLILGWIMTCDRLVRCGRDETKISQKIIIKGRKYSYDPVAANDFWWEKENK